MTIRAAYGIFFDAPHLHQYGGRRDTAPKGAQIVVNGPSFDDPWASQPGGNPFPIPLDKNSPFPLAGRYTVFPWEMKKPYINQLNMSVQKQFGMNFNPPQPELNLTSSTFGKSIQAFTGAPKISFTGLERTMQIALKYVF